MARLPLRQPTPQLQVCMACYRPSTPARLSCCSPHSGSQTTARSQFTANPYYAPAKLVVSVGVCHVRIAAGKNLKPSTVRMSRTGGGGDGGGDGGLSSVHSEPWNEKAGLGGSASRSLGSSFTQGPSDL
eukprot:2945899-Alexandrium_andersonii.AAC.1